MIYLAALSAAASVGLLVVFLFVGGRLLGLVGISEPALTTIRQPIAPAGRRLAEMLLAALDGVPPGDLQEVWEPRLVVRGSDGTFWVAGFTGAQASNTGTQDAYVARLTLE